MDAVSPLPAAVALCVAFITAMLIGKKFGYPPAVNGRSDSIDGLRGYLAFFVFLHHSCIWYFYLQTAKVEVPPSNLYTNFGQGSVALFFMITGFLFFSKLIEGKTKPIDWGKLYVSRFLRLTPLYLFLMLIFFILVAYMSNGILVDSIPKLTKGIIKWMGFRMLGAPDLNGAPYLSMVVGVTWSLPYEWFFYLTLPLLALIIGVNPPRLYIAIGIVGLIWLVMWRPDARCLYPFLGGIVASFLVRIESFCKFAVSRLASFIIIGCCGMAMIYYPSDYDAAPLLLLSVAFALIASGNSLFGILTNAASRTLGEFAYGIYLLHSVILFVVFNFVIGLPASMILSPIIYWSVVLCITPILIIVCFLTFRLIERPALRSTTAVTYWFRVNIILKIKQRFMSVPA